MKHFLRDSKRQICLKWALSWLLMLHKHSVPVNAEAHTIPQLFVILQTIVKKLCV